MPSIAEILKRRGVIKRTPEEIEQIAQQAVCKIQTVRSPLLKRLDISLDTVLRWKDYALNTKLDNPYALAYVPKGFVAKITRNPSGKYRDKHLFSLHTYTDDLKPQGHLRLETSPLVTQWLSCHYTEERTQTLLKWLTSL